MTIFQKIPEGDNHGLSEISEVCVVLFFLCEDVALIYDSRDVADIHNFRLVEFSNHIFSEV